MKSLPPTLKSWADRARSFAYNCRLWTENNPSQAFGDRKAAASPITDLKQMRRLGNAPIVEVAGLHDLPLHHFRPTEANGVPSEPSERRLAVVSCDGRARFSHPEFGASGQWTHWPPGKRHGYEAFISFGALKRARPLAILLDGQGL
jgi:hypothetical protein